MAIFKEGDRVKLSTKGRYGLRALIDLAQYSEQTPVSITSISSRQDLSERYLEQLMSMLKKSRSGQKRPGRRRRVCTGKAGGSDFGWRCAQSAGGQSGTGRLCRPGSGGRLQGG